MPHDGGHELLEGAAGAILVIGGALILALAARTGPRGGSASLVSEPPTSVTRAVVAVAAALSLGSAVIHLAAAPGHLAELGLLGGGFIVAAAFQAGWALAWLIEPAATVIRLGILGNVAIVAAWVASRTVGLPVGTVPWQPESMGPPDLVATTFELALVALLVARSAGVERRLIGRLRDAGSLATITAVPAIGIVVLATTLALAGDMSHGHEPGAGHENPAGQEAPPDR